jgi:hypothetical protein
MRGRRCGGSSGGRRYDRACGGCPALSAALSGLSYMEVGGRMRLQQNQVWKQGDQFLRVVVLERLRVEYKSMKDISSREGTHHQVSKKAFCRLLKDAVLVSPPETTARDA